ncbi:hypothetical protein SGPA1_30950 [Streptomyces misionensis JCM 4497]
MHIILAAPAVAVEGGRILGTVGAGGLATALTVGLVAGIRPSATAWLPVPVGHGLVVVRKLIAMRKRLSAGSVTPRAPTPAALADGASAVDGLWHPDCGGYSSRCQGRSPGSELPLPVCCRRAAVVTMTPTSTAPNTHGSTGQFFATLTNSSTSAATKTPASTAPLLPLLIKPPRLECAHRAAVPAGTHSSTARLRTVPPRPSRATVRAT